MLRAVIFDVDGTLAETERDGHRDAFNRAFERLGLPDRWDELLYDQLVRVAGSRERLAHYFDRHRSLSAAERERLAEEAYRIKNEEFRRLVAAGRIRVRPGILRLIDTLQAGGLLTAVATAGSRGVIQPLLEKLLGRDRVSRLAAIVTGEDVARKKPDPEVYRLTLSKLRLSPCEALVVEDSQNGLEAAKAAGLPCLIVPSHYRWSHDFGRADLIVEELGDPGVPSRVLYNPHGITVDTRVEMETLCQLHRAAIAASSPRPRGAASVGQRIRLPVGRHAEPGAVTPSVRTSGSGARVGEGNG